MEYKIIIGIDPGSTTGYAEYWHNNLSDHTSGKAVEIENKILKLIGDKFLTNEILAIIEDARQMVYIPWSQSAKKQAKSRSQGAGQIKKDSKRWEEFLQYHKIPYAMISPKQNTHKKLSEEVLSKVIDQKIGRSSQHARDAISCAFVGLSLLKQKRLDVL